MDGRLAADLREMVSEQREYRELLVRLTLRDLLLRYKQTVMGAGWAMFMPLVNTAVFSIIFTRVGDGTRLRGDHRSIASNVSAKLNVECGIRRTVGGAAAGRRCR